MLCARTLHEERLCKCKATWILGLGTALVVAPLFFGFDRLSSSLSLHGLASERVLQSSYENTRGGRVEC